MPEAKERLDILLVNRGLFSSRQRAQAAIMAGLVLVEEEKVEKSGTKVATTAEIRILGKEHPYVSRGGLKLAKALELFVVKVEGKVVLDVGASTGGFTDCLLQHGASRVYAVDVGSGQLAWSLRQDPRVVVFERTNIRHLPAEALPEPIDLTCIDVSFISLEKVLPVVVPLLTAQGAVIALVKPQFEAGPEKVGKGGIVRDPGVHQEVLNNLKKLSHHLQLKMTGLTFSPIVGAKGNKEYLVYLAKEGTEIVDHQVIVEVVNAAWQQLP